MFEPPPEKPSAFARYWLLIVGCVGGGLGVGGVGWAFGHESLQNDVVMIGSFIGGAFLAVLAMWKVIVPPGAEPPEM
jgi:hypothetical protein